MVRRLKGDLRDIGSNFPKREVVPIKFSDLAADAPELRLADLLSQYGDMREEQLKDADRKVQQASGLVISHLQKASALFDRGFRLDAPRPGDDARGGWPLTGTGTWALALGRRGHSGL